MKHGIQESGDEEVGWIPVGSRSGSHLTPLSWTAIDREKIISILLDTYLYFSYLCIVIQKQIKPI